MSDTRPSWWRHLHDDEKTELAAIDANSAQLAGQRRKLIMRAKKRQQRAKDKGPAQ